MHTCNNSQGAGIYSFTRKIPGAIHTITHTQGAGIYNFTRDIPGADLDPALKPIIFPYIDLNLQVRGNAHFMYFVHSACCTQPRARRPRNY
jgi:hypothetical protein